MIIKNIKMLSCAALISTVVFTGGLAAPTAYAAETQQTSTTQSTAVRTITVTGYGEVTVQPDIAYVQLGLHTTGKTAREAQEKNAKQFTAIRTALTKLKISPKDIQTARFSTMPDYSWNNNKQELKGYQVEHIIQIKCRDLKNIGHLLDTAAAAGANRIDSVWFTSENMEQHQLAASDIAIDNARVKADRIAKRAGVTIKEAIQITDGSIPNSPMYYDMQRTGNSANSAKADATGSQIAPGELKVGTSVTITYSY
ncbi:SIMPL domain-containing protein [Aneurinibacillus sp. REN35]|uniref:SIMPL domain-containing protein n=1 Tax=Aneurinibacillus sp. REN35 TaxID=3237286 RepID=UPI003528BFB0